MRQLFVLAFTCYASKEALLSLIQKYQYELGLQRLMCPKNFTGFEGQIIWDASKPDGQPRRCLDTPRAKAEFGFEAKMDFDEALQRTVEWYKKHAVKT
jgi:hypothetical protein